MKGKIRWGIVGPGKIARKFARDLLLFEDAQIFAVASRNLERAEQFAAMYQIPKAFGSYRDLFRSSEVDIVYIATPHNFHKDLAIEAMRSGKHVLCEKPLGINSAEVKELVEISMQCKVFLMEGLWSRFNPSIQKVKQMVDGGQIGDVVHLYADFAFYALDKGEDSRLLNPKLASGSVLDIGIYPIFLSYLILGMPLDIHAFSNFHKNGTELQTSILFKYSNALSVLYSGLTGTSTMEAKISGSGGELSIHPRWHEANGFSIRKGNRTKKHDLPTWGNGLAHEIEEVHKCLKENRIESTLWTHQNSLDLMFLMDEVRIKTGAKSPFEA